jgi:hypothetical protein
VGQAEDLRANSLIDLCAIAPFVWRHGHHSVVDFDINRQRAIELLFSPFPPQIEGA